LCKKAIICALPVYFSDEIPRAAVGSQKFFLTDEFFHSTEKTWYDEEKEVGFQLYTKDELLS
jgi:hypothetical protein